MLPTNQASPAPSHRCLIPINIETLAGSSFELLVSPYEQIQYIKRKIERREGIPVSHQHLVWKSNELKDESCLHDYKIEAGTTIKLVLAMRGGPVNTKRVPIEDSLLRDVSEYMESNRDDVVLNSDLLPSSSNKNVTFLVLRDGDQFNFFQVIDRGDGTLSPLSGSVSNASMYSTHEAIAIEPERDNNEKRQDDDRKTKEKMETIRSKLKTHAKKDNLPLRPPSATKQLKPDLIQHSSRNVLMDSSSNLATNGNNSPLTISSDQQQQQQSTPRLVPYKFASTNLFNTYNILAAAAIEQSEFLHEEDSEDDEDSNDEDDEQQVHGEQLQEQQIMSPSTPLIPVNSKKQQVLTSRSYSPSVFCHKKHHQYDQESYKKSLFHSHHHHQDRTTKNLIGQHESANTMDTYAQSSMNTILTTSYPSVTLGPVAQETAISATTTSSGNETSTGTVLVDYISRISPTLHQQQVPIVSTSSRILSATMTKRASICETSSVATNVECILDGEEKITSSSELVYQQSQTSPMLELLDDDMISPTNGLISAASIRDDKTEVSRKQTGDIQSRNETSLSKTIWTDDDDQLIIGDEYIGEERTSTSQSILSQHRNSSTSATVITPMPTLPSVIKKSTLPSTKQQFYHHHKPLNSDQQTAKLSPRPLMPFSLSKYRRIPANVHSISALQQQTYTGTSNASSNDSTNNGNVNNSTDSFNEHLILNKRIEILKPSGKQQSSPSCTASPMTSTPSSAVSTTAMFTSSPSQSKRNISQQQPETKSLGASGIVPPPSTSSSLMPLDNAKVTIETIGPKTVTALLRQNATIEPVDTSRGMGKHLVSLLTTASKETTSVKPNYKQSSRDVVIEERFKLDSKLTNPWSSTTMNNSTTMSSSLQSTAATIYNSNKLPSVIVNRKSTSKCFLCKKKTGLATTYQCRCGSSFCSEHRYPEAHACAFDYKAEGKRLIERNNPLVTAPKLPKI